MEVTKNPLAKIRGFLGKTQAWADDRCGLNAGSYIRREISEDIRINTLVKTLNAFGLKVRLVIELDNGDEIKLKMTEK